MEGAKYEDANRFNKYGNFVCAGLLLAVASYAA